MAALFYLGEVRSEDKSGIKRFRYKSSSSLLIVEMSFF